MHNSSVSFLGQNYCACICVTENICMGFQQHCQACICLASVVETILMLLPLDAAVISTLSGIANARKDHEQKLMLSE